MHEPCFPGGDFLTTAYGPQTTDHGPLRLPRTNRLAGQFVYLQSSHHATNIIGMNSLGTEGIDASKALMQRLRAERLGFKRQPPSDRFIGGGTVEQATDQSHEIERRAADEQNLLFASFNFARAAFRLV